MFTFRELQIPEEIRYIQIPSDVEFVTPPGRGYSLPAVFEGVTSENEAVIFQNMKIPIEELKRVPRTPYNLKINGVLYRVKDYYVFKKEGGLWRFVDELESTKELYYVVRILPPFIFDLYQCSIFIDQNIFSYGYTRHVLYVVSKPPARLRLWTLTGYNYPPETPSEITKAIVYINGSDERDVKIKVKHIPLVPQQRK